MLSAKRFQDILRKFATIGSKPTFDSFPELEDCIIWLRFVLAVSYGIYLGPNSGALGCIYGLNIITFIPILYCQVLLLADMDSYKNLHFVGLPNALAMMMLTWIFGFTRHYSAEELKLASAVVIQQYVVAQQDPEDGVVVVPNLDSISVETIQLPEETASIATPGVADDTEF